MGQIQQQQMMDVSMGSMGVEGTTWWKQDGSDHFTVRDVMMGPDGITVRTTDGRMLNGSVLETYIQSEVPINIPKQAPVRKIDVGDLDKDTPVEPTKPLGTLKNSHPGVTFPEDTNHYGIPKDPINEPITPTPPTPDIDSVDVAIIERVLGNADFNCIQVEVVDDGIIASGIGTLHDVLNIKREAIEKYLVAKIKTNLGNIAENAAKQLMQVIPTEE